MAKRAADTQMTKDDPSEGQGAMGFSVGDQIVGPQRATAAQLANRRLAKPRGGVRPPTQARPSPLSQQSLPPFVPPSNTNNTNQSQQQAGGFAFGQPAGNMQPQGSGFTFSQSTNQTAQPAGALDVGPFAKPTQQTGVFSFGQPAKETQQQPANETPQQGGSFSFGQPEKATPQEAGVFALAQSAKDTQKQPGAFTFGQPTDTAQSNQQSASFPPTGASSNTSVKPSFAPQNASFDFTPQTEPFSNRRNPFTQGAIPAKDISNTGYHGPIFQMPAKLGLGVKSPSQWYREGEQVPQWAPPHTEPLSSEPLPSPTPMDMTPYQKPSPTYDPSTTRKPKGPAIKLILNPPKKPETTQGDPNTPAESTFQQQQQATGGIFTQSQPQQPGEAQAPSTLKPAEQQSQAASNMFQQQNQQQAAQAEVPSGKGPVEQQLQPGSNDFPQNKQQSATEVPAPSGQQATQQQSAQAQIPSVSEPTEQQTPTASSIFVQKEPQQPAQALPPSNPEVVPQQPANVQAPSASKPAEQQPQNTSSIFAQNKPQQPEEAQAPSKPETASQQPAQAQAPNILKPAEQQPQNSSLVFGRPFQPPFQPAEKQQNQLSSNIFSQQASVPQQQKQPDSNASSQQPTSSVFAQQQQHKQPTSNGFGQQTTSNLFSQQTPQPQGQKQATSNVFGQQSPSHIFGQAQQGSKPTSNVFSQQPQESQKQPTSSVFGQQATSNVFGQQQQGQPTSNMFSQQPQGPQQPSTSSVFGQQPKNNVFGQQQQGQSTSNMFSQQPQGPQQPSTSSVFGQQLASNVFGQQQQGQSTSNVFGQQQQGQSTSNVFGQQQQGQSTSNVFGQQQHQPRSNMFGYQQNQAASNTFAHNNQQTTSDMSQTEASQASDGLSRFADMNLKDSPFAASVVSFMQEHPNTEQASAAQPQASIEAEDYEMSDRSPNASPPKRRFAYQDEDMADSDTVTTTLEPGPSLFDRITRPPFETHDQDQDMAGSSNEITAPGTGGSLFDRITRPPIEAHNFHQSTSGPSNEITAPGTGGSLFDRITRPPIEAHNFHQSTSGPSNEITAPGTSGSLFDRVTRPPIEAHSYHQSTSGPSHNIIAPGSGEMFNGVAGSPAETHNHYHSTAGRSDENTSKGTSGSIFDSVARNAIENENQDLVMPDTHVEITAPGAGHNLFSRITGPNIEKHDVTAAVLSGNIDKIRPSSSTPTPMHIAQSNATEDREGVVDAPVSERPNQLSGAVDSTEAFTTVDTPHVYLSGSNPPSQDQGRNQSSHPDLPAQSSNSITQAVPPSNNTRALGTPPPTPADFSDEETRQFTTAWRLRYLEAGLKKYLRDKGTAADTEMALKFFEDRRQAILAAKGEDIPSLVGSKRKAENGQPTIEAGHTDEPRPKKSKSNFVNSTLSNGVGSKQLPPDHGSPLAQLKRANEKRIADEELARQEKARAEEQSQASKRKAGEDESVHSKKPRMEDQSQTSNVLKHQAGIRNAESTLNGTEGSNTASTSPKKLEPQQNSTPSTRPVSSFYSQYTGPSKHSDILQRVISGRGPPYFSDPDSTAGARGSTMPTKDNSISAEIAGPPVARDSASSGETSANAPKLPEFKVPSFSMGAGASANWTAQFSKAAAKSTADSVVAEKAKRKAEDFDSDEENEAEWERKFEESERSKRQKLEASKGQRAQLVNGKFVFTNSSGTADSEATKVANLPASKAPTASSGTSSAAPKLPEFKVPSFGTGASANWVSQFSKVAAKSTADSANTEKAKRKAAEFDSDEDDEADWERKFEESERLKRQKLEASKTQRAQLINGKFVFTGSSGIADSEAAKPEPSKPNDSVLSQPPKNAPNESVLNQPRVTLPNSKNIFGHLSSEESGAEGSKTGDADDEGDEGHDEDDDTRNSVQAADNPSIGGLFGRISRDDGGNAVRETANHTWKPDSPIKFGSTGTPPTVNVTSPSPSKQPLTGLFGAPKLNTISETPLKPASTLFTSIPPKTPSVGFNFGFTPSNAATKTLAPPSNNASGATSRATSPGATTGESANESTGDGEEGNMPKDEQIDLTAGGPGEEDEDVVFQVKAKAMVYNRTSSSWDTKGVGFLRVLKNRDTRQARVLMRQDPSGRVMLNTGLLPQIKYESRQSKQTRIPFADGGKVEVWVVKVAKDEDAKRLAEVLEEHK